MDGRVEDCPPFLSLFERSFVLIVLWSVTKFPRAFDPRLLFHYIEDACSIYLYHFPVGLWLEFLHETQPLLAISYTNIVLEMECAIVSPF